MVEKAINYTEAVAIAHTRGLYETDVGVPPETDELLAWLARLRLLNGVPFAYLVNDAQLLPPESIRFFYLDRNWTDAAVDGALSVGTITSRDRTQLQSVYTGLRDDIDATERQLFQSRTGAQVTEGEAEVATGLLLRSRAVSGWPGLHVHAYRGPGPQDELGIMRIERLAPAVLLALFDGLPRYVTITEPRQGIQFGVDPKPGEDDRRIFRVRDATGDEQDVDPDERHVPFRRGSPGVIHWGEFADRLRGHLDPAPVEVSSAQVGLHMLRFPYEQDFGDPGDDPETRDTFVANVAFERLVASNQTAWMER